MRKLLIRAERGEGGDAEHVFGAGGGDGDRLSLHGDGVGNPVGKRVFFLIFIFVILYRVSNIFHGKESILKIYLNETKINGKNVITIQIWFNTVKP